MYFGTISLCKVSISLSNKNTFEFSRDFFVKASTAVPSKKLESINEPVETTYLKSFKILFSVMSSIALPKLNV